MKIQRITYRRLKGEVVPRSKQIYTKIDEHHALLQIEVYTNGKWLPSTQTCWFDGSEVHNGFVKYTGDDVDNLFKLMIEYEGYSWVKESYND